MQTAVPWWRKASKPETITSTQKKSEEQPQKLRRMPLPRNSTSAKKAIEILTFTALAIPGLQAKEISPLDCTLTRRWDLGRLDHRKELIRMDRRIEEEGKRIEEDRKWEIVLHRSNKEISMRAGELRKVVLRINRVICRDNRTERL